MERGGQQFLAFHFSTNLTCHTPVVLGTQGSPVRSGVCPLMPDVTTSTRRTEHHWTCRMSGCRMSSCTLRRSIRAAVADDAVKAGFVLKALSGKDDFFGIVVDRRHHSAFQYIPDARNRMRIPTAVRTRWISDEEQTRFPAGQPFDWAGAGYIFFLLLLVGYRVRLSPPEPEFLSHSTRLRGLPARRRTKRSLLSVPKGDSRLLRSTSEVRHMLQQCG